MFKILVLDKRDSIRTAIKYLLYRYELVFSRDLKDAIDKLNENNIDMLLINLPLEDDLGAKLGELFGKKKIIGLIDAANHEFMERSGEFGVLECIDKMDIARLPELVDRHLNKSDTQILEV